MLLDDIICKELKRKLFLALREKYINLYFVLGVLYVQQYFYDLNMFP